MPTLRGRLTDFIERGPGHSYAAVTVMEDGNELSGSVSDYV